MSILPLYLGRSACVQRQGMGSTLVPGVGTVTASLLRECHMKGEGENTGPLGLCLLEQHSAAGPPTLGSASNSVFGLPSVMVLPL